VVRALKNKSVMLLFTVLLLLSVAATNMSETARLTITVVDSEGNPVSGVQIVQLYYRITDSGFDVLVGLANECFTDEQGTCTIETGDNVPRDDAGTIYSSITVYSAEGLEIGEKTVFFSADKTVTLHIEADGELQHWSHSGYEVEHIPTIPADEMYSPDIHATATAATFELNQAVATAAVEGRTIPTAMPITPTFDENGNLVVDTTFLNPTTNRLARFGTALLVIGVVLLAGSVIYAIKTNRKGRQ
jgi:hypothetical protein